MTGVLLMVSVVLHGVDEPASPAAVEDVRRAIAAYQAESNRLMADPKKVAEVADIASNFFTQVAKLRESEAKQEKIFTQAVAQHTMQAIGSDETHLHQGLVDALTEAIGKDKAEAVVAECYIPHGRDYTPTSKNAFSTGKDGTLWIFWSQDCPQVDYLAGKINTFRRDHPEIAVYDVHMMPLIGWYNAIKYLASVRAQLLQLDPARTPEQQYDEKLAIRDKAMAAWTGFNAMCRYNRDGGYMMVEDMTAAKAYGVTNIPCFRFISPGGAMHKLEGVSSTLDLGEWVRRIADWESKHLEEEKQRVLHH